jgi:hypothetical protein
MLLINSKPIDVLARQDEQNPMHIHAIDYEKGIQYLKETFGTQLKFVRPGFPKRSRGIDSRKKEVPNMLRPTPPMRIPLKSEVVGKTGTEIWEYCEGAPKLLPNNLLEATGKRGIQVEDQIVISLNKSPELAFFLYYKSPFMNSLLKIDDPTAEAKAEGDKARAELDLQTALYSILGDEDQLRIVSQAYGINKTDTKHPDALRKELKTVVLAGEQRKKSDPAARGIKEFLEELKVTDSVRLRSLIMTMIEAKKITWSGDGRYKVGDRELCRVSASELSTKQDFLCRHLSNPANRLKLQELLKDVVDKDYLDKITDDKTFVWLARIGDIKHNFKKSGEIRESVYSFFVEEVVE